MDIIRKEIKFFVIVIFYVEVLYEMVFYLLFYKNVLYCIWECWLLVMFVLKFFFFYGDFNFVYVLDGVFKMSFWNFFNNECWLKFYWGEICNFYLFVKLLFFIDDGIFFIVSEWDRKVVLCSVWFCSCNKIKWFLGIENFFVW